MNKQRGNDGCSDGRREWSDKGRKEKQHNNFAFCSSERDERGFFLCERSRVPCARILFEVVNQIYDKALKLWTRSTTFLYVRQHGNIDW